MHEASDARDLLDEIGMLNSCRVMAPDVAFEEAAAATVCG
jgi:hypothetical protein